MYKSIADFEKGVPAVKNFSPEEKQKAMDILNGLLEAHPDMDEKMAIATALKKGQLTDVAEGMIFMLSSGKSIIEILRAGTVHDRGFKVTEEMLEDYVKNFHAGVYGTRVQVNFRHDREGEAAGWLTNLIKEGPKLFAEVEWTPLGKEKITTKQYQFTSAELALSYPHFETGEKVKNVLIGVALTNIPAVKGLAPVQLSEEVQVFINSQSLMEKLKELYEKLAAQAEISEEDMQGFEKEAKAVGTDEAVDMTKKLSSKVKKLNDKKAPEEPAKKPEEGTVKLAEFEAERKARLELEEKVLKMELNEQVGNTLLLSDERAVGFPSGEKDKLVDFMVKLSAEQRAEFLDLMSKVQTVDLRTIGSADAAKKKEFSPEAVVELAEKKLAEAKAAGKDLSIVEAQKLATAELSK